MKTRQISRSGLGPATGPSRLVPRSVAGVLAGAGLLLMAACEAPLDVVALTGLSLSGESVSLFESNGSETRRRPTVALFVDPQCPISNRYTPAIQAINQTFGDRIALWLVYPNSILKPDAIRTHVREYGLPGRVVRDPEHRIVAAGAARVTPEAAVFDADGTLIYHGRIDDRFVDFNQQRPVPTRHDLREVLLELLDTGSAKPHMTVAAGTPVRALSQPGIGCFLSDLK